MLLACLLLALAAPAAGDEARASSRARPGARAPQTASYVMEATLDPAAKTVSGRGQISYVNPSGDTLDEIYLRLYLRAFRDMDSVWMRESSGDLRGFRFNPAEAGDIVVSKLAVAGGADLLASATISDTLLRAPLPAPLAPGATLTLEVEWTSKLPRVFARTGYGGRGDTFFMVGQWYPKMAVYERGRWDTEPWHANSEFFHDFGRYAVAINVPRDYIVAATGMPDGDARDTGRGVKTYRFTADDVSDFAFAASPDFRTRTAPAGDAEVALYYLPEHESLVGEYLRTATGSLQAYSRWFGAYPHPRLTVVDVPDDAGGAGGMEYPTLITGGTVGAPGDSGILALVVSHEIAHQWWPMQTATNEGREPWLDEGLTQYSGLRYMIESGGRIGVGGVTFSPRLLDRLQYRAAPNLPVNKPAWEYTTLGYGGAVYSKAALGFYTLENIVGTERLRRALADYLAQYRWKHPTSADLRASLEASLGGDLRWFFDEYVATGAVIDYAADEIESADGESNATVRRVGGVRAPVEVQLTLASGAREMKTWDGQTERVRYALPASDPIIRVEVDPARKLAAETNLLNNGVSARNELAPAVTLAGRLMAWFQLLAQWIGLFG